MFTSILYNKIDPTHITKQVSNVDVDENALDNVSPKRTIVDVSTDTFIKNIFGDNNNYYLFLNYVNFLDIYLNYYANLQMVQTQTKPIYAKEEIEVYFKGGNVMNYHFGEILSKLDKNIQNRISDKFSPFFKKSDFDFSVSIQTDSYQRFNQIRKYVYQLILEYLFTTKNYFNNYIKNITNNISIKTRIDPKIIDTFFNKDYVEEFNKVLHLVKSSLKNPRFMFNIEIAKQYHKNVRNYSRVPQIKNIKVNHKYLDVEFVDNTKFIMETFTPTIKYDNYVISKINESMDEYNEVIINMLLPLYNTIYESDRSYYHACLLYPYYKLTIADNIIHEKIYDNYIKSIQLYNFELMQKNNFYTVDKINTMYDNIKSTLIEMAETTPSKNYYSSNSRNPPQLFEKYDPKSYNVYTLDIGAEPKIMAAGRDDFIIYNDFMNPQTMTAITYGSDQKTLHINPALIDDAPTNNNNFHYISVNYLIKTVLWNNRVSDFDLFRIKYNIVANDIVLKDSVRTIFNVPSEFIDISVNLIDSNQYDEDEGKFIMPIKIENIILPYVPVKSHSYVYFISDLSRILFLDNGFFPWFKSKYEKRLRRLILLIYFYDLHKNTKLLDKIYDLSVSIKNILNNNNTNKINIDKLASNVMVDSYTQFNDFYDMFILSSEYKIVEPLVKLLIIMYKILTEDQEKMLGVINYFRSFIKMEPLTEIDNLRSDFIKFLEQIILIYNDIYFNSVESS